RAVTLAGRGEVSEAAAILPGTADINSDASLLAVRGDIYLKASMLKEAKSDYMRAESLRQGSGLYGLAKCAATEGDAKTAVSLLEAHLKSNLRKSEPQILLDEAFKPVSASPEWRTLWKKDWYKVFERKSWEIENYLKSGRNDMAEGAYAELASLYPESAVTEYCHARILMGSGKYREAADILATVTRDSDTPAAWLYALAEAWEGEGNSYAAATVYDRLISARTPDPGLLLKKARMLIRSGDRDAAKKEMQRYISIDPDNTEALGLIGRTYAEEGAIYEALPYLNENVERHPGEASAFRLRGDAWLAARTWDRAAEDYTMSLDLDPDNGTVNLSLGIALINSGRSDDACHYLRRARSLGVKEATDYLAKYCLR
ncbi:MAG: tetratricopeptide repeat protein, partial [Bacteroidota bacterium]|nr:tetratricopeptide repeat protein [Bacteroidota bacterium]